MTDEATLFLSFEGIRFVMHVFYVHVLFASQFLPHMVYKCNVEGWKAALSQGR